MSRQSVMPSRNLTLMEELERLEQSITLTLQEIDHNFSRAHRIVTTSILPVVEDYARHSNAVWQGSEFWKGFFEASANVKLSSYEEPAEGEETLEAEDTVTGQDFGHDPTSTPARGDEDTTTTAATPERHPVPRYRKAQAGSSSPVSSPPPAGYGTPQAQSSTKATSLASGPGDQTVEEEEPSFAEFPSPYESLKQEMSGKARSKPAPSTRNAKPTTPGIPIPKLQPTKGNIPQPPDSSPLLAPPTTTYMMHGLQQPQQSSQKPPNGNPDLLLHRVLDKNYRLQATPLKTARTQPTRPTTTSARTPGATAQKPPQFLNPMLLDSSPFSPPVAAPQLRSEIFGSPVRAGGTSAAPRTPGVSVQKAKRYGAQYGFGRSTGKTPREATRGGKEDDTANIFGPATAQNTEKIQAHSRTQSGTHPQQSQVWNSDSDPEDSARIDTLEELGISPPKTLQFHVPASRLLQTPAREASRRIVQDLMVTAGMEVGEESILEGGIGRMDLGERRLEEEYEDQEEYGGGGGGGGFGEDDSPSVVRVMRRDADADAFGS